MALTAWIEEYFPNACEHGEGFSDVWLDIETRKVDAPENWPFKKRWSVFMVGIAYKNDTDLHINVYSGTEREIIDYLTELLFETGLPQWVNYSATREFDEMILSGRFTNARAAHQEYPGPWPHLPSGVIPWRNIRTLMDPIERTRCPDLPSKDIPKYWATGLEPIRALVAWHCYKDVIELVLGDPWAYVRENVRESLLEDFASKDNQLMWISAAKD